jgi:CMP-N-acetylneuraminic acid synthetase
MRILALIPARAGSKGVPGKNTRPLAGKPLLLYTIEAAQACREIDHVMLTTDDETAAQIARDAGVDVPFMRPASLAADDTAMLPVVQHAVAWLEARGRRYDLIALLQPTNPLRRPEHIDRCISALVRDDADSAMTVLPVPPKYNPHWVYFEADDGTLRLSTGAADPPPRRQVLPAAFHREGSVYLVRRDVLLEEGRLYGRRVVGVPLEPEDTVAIDTPEDWERAEALLRKRRSAAAADQPLEIPAP